MTRSIRELKGRLRDRRGRPGGEAAARAFLDWLVDENYVLMGVLRFRRGAGRLRARLRLRARRAQRARAPARRLPGRHGRGAEAPRDPDDDDRIIDIDYRNNASAIHHLEPVDDIVIREWGADGRARGRDAPPRPPRQERLHREGGVDPAPQAEARLAARELRRDEELARLPRDPGHLQPLPEARALLRRRGVAQGHHRPAWSTCRATTRSSPPSAGAPRTARCDRVLQSRCSSKTANDLEGRAGAASSARSRSAPRPTAAPPRSSSTTSTPAASSTPSRRTASATSRPASSRPGRTRWRASSSTPSARSRGAGSSSGTCGRRAAAASTAS